VIWAAAVLVLAGIGLFVAGVVTDGPVWYWACVGVSALAAVLLLLARRELARSAPGAAMSGGTGRPGAPSPAGRGGQGDEPPAEEVAASDLLMVMDMSEDVLVVDEHPRYHLEECPYLIGQLGIRVPVDQARTDGFTPCGLCAPDRRLASSERARRDEDAAGAPGGDGAGSSASSAGQPEP
jgi:hypothetical protein